MGVEELLDIIRKEFDKFDERYKLLLAVGCRHVLKTNIVLLRYLLNEKKLNGLYICVDIPQVHVERLLKIYNIESKGLKYIDAITPLSTFEPEYKENILYVENPFDAKMINDAINKIQTDGVKRFVILDNMATLQFYNSEIENFFNNFIGAINNFNVSYLMLAVDKQRHKPTYDIIRPYCDSELEIKSEWLNWLKDL